MRVLQLSSHWWIFLTQWSACGALHAFRFYKLQVSSQLKQILPTKSKIASQNTAFNFIISFLLFVYRSLAYKPAFLGSNRKYHSSVRLTSMPAA